MRENRSKRERRQGAVGVMLRLCRKIGAIGERKVSERRFRFAMETIREELNTQVCDSCRVLVAGGGGSGKDV